MGRRIEVDRENNEIKATRSLRLTGDSTVVGIPSEILQGAGLELGDDVRVVADMDTGEITIRKAGGGDSDDENDGSDEDGDSS